MKLECGSKRDILVELLLLALALAMLLWVLRAYAC